MFYVSTDGGFTFEEIDTGQDPLEPVKIAVDLPDIRIQTDHYLFWSEYHTRSWQSELCDVQFPGGLSRNWDEESSWLCGTNDNYASQNGNGVLYYYPFHPTWPAVQRPSCWAPFDNWNDYPVECVLADPILANIYTAYSIPNSYGYINYSLDDGATWTRTSGVLGRDIRDFDIREDNSNYVIAANRSTNGGALRSTDSGANWSSINSGLPTNTHALQIEYCPGQTNLALIGTDNGIYKSTNINAVSPSWSASNTGTVALRDTAMHFDPVDNSIICLSAVEQDDPNIVGYVYISADSGRSWNEINTGLENLVVSDIAADPSYPDTFYVATKDGVYGLKNPVKCGTLPSFPITQTWGPGTVIVNGDVTVPSGVTLNISPGTTLLFTYNFDKNMSGNSTTLSELIVYGTLNVNGEDGNPIVFESSNPDPTNQDWYGLYLGTGSSNSLNYCTIKDSYYGIYAYKPQDLTVAHCLFENNHTDGIKMDLNAQSNPPLIQYSHFSQCGTHGIWCSSRYFTANTDTFENCLYGIYYLGDLSPTIEGCRILRGTVSNSFYGIYIKKVTGQPSPTIESDYIQGFAQGGIYLEGASNACQIHQSHINSSGICGVELANSSPTITGSTGAGNLIESCTYGLYAKSSSSPFIRWTKFKENTSRGVLVEAGSYPNLGTNTPGGYGYNSFVRTNIIVTYYHVYNSNATNINAINNFWSPLSAQYFYHVNYQPYLTNDPLPRRALPGTGPLAEDLALATSYPNPFNPATTISFNLSSPQNVSVRIYNIMGQEVRDLYNGYKASGTVSMIWDGRDGQGQQVAAGMYFCSIRTEEKQETIKMTVLK